MDYYEGTVGCCKGTGHHCGWAMVCHGEKVMLWNENGWGGIVEDYDRTVNIVMEQGTTLIKQVIIGVGHWSIVAEE